MPGKPFQSKLAPHEKELFALLDSGMSYRKTAEELNRRHQLDVTHNAVFSFAKTRRKKPPTRKLFSDGFPRDLRESLLTQIAAVWTHDSTAIEGNALTLGETLMVLEHGLTISGKPLRDHQEVYGHARAIDLINDLVRQDSITDTDLFNLHKAVMDKAPIDYLRPIGNWEAGDKRNHRHTGRQTRLHGIRLAIRHPASNEALAGGIQSETGCGQHQGSRH